MDFLKAEIDRKRKAHALVRPTESMGGKKYFRRGDMEQKRVAQMKKPAEKSVTSKIKDAKALDAIVAPVSASLSDDETEAESKAEVSQLAPIEVKHRLRAIGQVITFFGETDAQRAERYRKVATTVTDENTDGHLNVVQQLLKAQEERGGFALQEGDTVETKKKKKKRKIEPILSRIMTVQDSIRSFLKRLQKEWKIALDNRPAEAKSSAMGKVDTAYYEEACINIKSLYKMLKKQICEEDIVGCLQRMMQGMIMGDYVKAMEVYVELTIGNAPWPMGVTSVGIHARAAREKIGERNSSGSGGQQAHILNNEEKRKYIHAVKRFMFFCQMKYPSDPSKMFEPGGIVNSTLTKGKMQALLKAKYDDTMTGFIAEQPTQGLKRPTNLWIQKAPHPHAAAFTSNSAGWGKAGDR